MSPKKKPRIALIDAAASTPINAAFASLAAWHASPAAPMSDSEPPSAQDSAPRSASDDSLEQTLKNLPKPHVFKTRKGRGGKTVTEIDHLEGLLADMLAPLCKRLCKSLGCGGSVTGQTIALQGDQVEDVIAFFSRARRP